MLFVLLDSADEEGLLQNISGEELWRAARKRVTTGRYSDEGFLFWTLMEEVDRSGALAGRWIGERWRTVQRRVTGCEQSYSPI